MQHEQPTFTVACLGCGHVATDEEGEEILVDFKARETANLANAELLRDIHEAKTGHRPYVQTEYEGDVHYPPWVEDHVYWEFHA